MRKVRALLSKTEAHGASPAEAAAAAALAQELMFKYNLEAADVTDRPADPIAAYTRKESYQERMLWRRDRTWMRRLMSAIARNNFCKSIHHETKDKRWASTLTLVGKPANIAFCEELFKWLVDELDGMRLAAWAEYNAQCKEAGDEPVHGTHFRANFYLGAVEVVGDRLDAQRKASEKAAQEAGTALIVLTGKELLAATSKLVGRLGSGTGPQGGYNNVARSMGRAAGGRVALTPSSRQVRD